MNNSLFSELPNRCNCGSPAELKDFLGQTTKTWRCRVQCTECERATLSYKTSSEAVTAWNRADMEE